MFVDSPEIPVYSIKEYNKNKGHTDPGTFTKQDILANQIYLVNETIRHLNQQLNTHSPNFSFFLQARKQITKKRHRQRKQKTVVLQYYNYKLYRDGIHPGQNLARVWLTELGNIIKLDCWR